MVEVVVDSIRICPDNRQHFVLLRSFGDRRCLVIPIGQYEAEAIYIALAELRVARPLTHDLSVAIVAALGAQVDRVVITAYETSIYYARLLLENGDTILELDARPSDAIALALRCHARIYVADAVLTEVGAWLPLEEEPAAVLLEPELANPDALRPFRDFINSLDLDDATGPDNADDGGPVLPTG